MLFRSLFHPSARISSPPAFAIVVWVLSQLLVTSVAVYTASFAKNTLQAILAALVILVASGGTLLLAAYWVHHIAHAPIPWIGQPHVGEVLMLPLLSAALVLTLCLFQWFAWSNFPRYGLNARRMVIQLAMILLSVWLLAWVFFSALFPPTLN